MKKSTFLSVVVPMLGVGATSLLMVSLPALGQKAKAWQTLMNNFHNPPADCWPGTRWWWWGSAVTKEEITWELEQMYAKGIRGVEQISMRPVYEKGNIPYLSDEFLAMVNHTLETAKRLGMKVSLNFGGPGWVLGGFWVPHQERSKNMVPTAMEIEGPHLFADELPKHLKKGHEITDQDQLLAVVAGRVIGNKIEKESLTDLTSLVKERCLRWQVPEGRWRLMAFWLRYTGQGNVVDHFNKAAMKRYCDFLGSKFYQSFGKEFGKTLDSLFCDSFEVALLPNAIYWSDGLIEEFTRFKGYNLIPYLPAIWWEVDAISPKIRYDVNEFLHWIGLEAFFKTFLTWCEQHGVKGRIQPYGFPTDILEGAGLTHIPEMEITPGEKDVIPWFDTRIGPKKYVSSGAHLYGRNIVSVEAYTYLHWQSYRATLEELKIASDGFLRSGANKFYNQGYNFSPERDVTLSRGFVGQPRISHENIWWKYYPLLTEYLARCSYLLRQGDFAPDIAIYSPLTNQWTLGVLNLRRWTRDFNWGKLGKLLIANGYDFDLVNDDILQTRAQIDDGEIKVGNLKYKILILPNIKALPLKTMEFIQQYVRQGGVVIALERLPDSSVGFADFVSKDEKVRAIIDEMFEEPSGRNDTAPMDYGNGRTYYIKGIMGKVFYNLSDVVSSPKRLKISTDPTANPFVNALRHHLPPDFGFDFASEGLQENDGLTFIHRKLKDGDIYFVTNLQDRTVHAPITFRVNHKLPWKWNPYNGAISRIFHYRENAEATEVPLRLAPYESTFLVFISGQEKIHVEQSNFSDILKVTEDEIEALATDNGNHRVTLNKNGRENTRSFKVTDVPNLYVVAGVWNLSLEGPHFPRTDTKLTSLAAWTDDPDARHFSGTGRYEINFVLPEKYVAADLQLWLDLGKVGNVAEVELNGTNVGTIWMRGQTLDITDAVRVGSNRMAVLVTNTLINRVSGLRESPPVPGELVSHYGKSTPPRSVKSHSPIGFEPLPDSGLMGPVEIRACKKIVFNPR